MEDVLEWNQLRMSKRVNWRLCSYARCRLRCCPIVHSTFSVLQTHMVSGTILGVVKSVVSQACEVCVYLLHDLVAMEAIGM